MQTCSCDQVWHWLHEMSGVPWWPHVLSLDQKGWERWSEEVCVWSADELIYSLPCSHGSCVAGHQGVHTSESQNYARGFKVQQEKQTRKRMAAAWGQVL